VRNKMRSVTQNRKVKLQSQKRKGKIGETAISALKICSFST
jgi:hypothetical protein